MDDYGPRRDGSLPDLTQYILTASLLCDDISSYASEETIDISSSRLEVIETWLAAHFYGQSDKPLSEEDKGEAAAVYDGKTGMFLTSTRYGQTAIRLDSTGYLAKLEEDQAGNRRGSIEWLGINAARATPYDSRG
jgi:hypothetical protein